MEQLFEKIYQAHLPNIKLGSMDRPALIVFSAIPGSGKSELTKRLVEKYGVSCIANKDIRKSLEQTRHADDVTIGDYTLWLLDKLTEQKPLTLVFDRNIDQWYEPIKDWAKRNNYKFVVVQIEVSRDALEKRLHKREGEKVSHVLGVLDFYHKEHERLTQSIRPSIVLRDDYDLDAAARLIVDTATEDELNVAVKEKIGLKRGTVQVVPYNMAWPQLFADEKKHLEAALGNLIHGIEHIGSTSVPGLSAKPIIDMIAAVDSLEGYEKFIRPLEALGYEFMPERVFADRVFFPKGPRENRTHHLSLVVKDSPGWHDPIRFRDYLIANPKVREAYQKLKLELASKHPNDRASYTKAKETMIQGIMDKI